VAAQPHPLVDLRQQDRAVAGVAVENSLTRLRVDSMEMRVLGTTGVRVSPLCLGAAAAAVELMLPSSSRSWLSSVIAWVA